MKSNRKKELDQVIKRFGNCLVTNTGIIWDPYFAEYFIDKNTLWDTRTIKQDIVWDWPLHLATKRRITKLGMAQFIQAFFFAQDNFKALRPNYYDKVSTARTLEILDAIFKERGPNYHIRG